jgi:hypothetical protein
MPRLRWNFDDRRYPAAPVLDRRSANGTRPHAVIQLCGIEDVLAPAMLAVAEQVRRAVSALGVEEVSIEVVRQDSESRETSA